MSIPGVRSSTNVRVLTSQQTRDLILDDLEGFVTAVYTRPISNYEDEEPSDSEIVYLTSEDPQFTNTLSSLINDPDFLLRQLGQGREVIISIGYHQRGDTTLDIYYRAINNNLAVQVIVDTMGVPRQVDNQRGYQGRYQGGYPSTQPVRVPEARKRTRYDR